MAGMVCSLRHTTYVHAVARWMWETFAARVQVRCVVEKEGCWCEWGDWVTALRCGVEKKVAEFGGIWRKVAEGGYLKRPRLEQ